MMPLPPMADHLNVIIGKLDQDETMCALEGVIRAQAARFNQSPGLLAAVLTRRMIRAVPDAEPEPEDGAA